jgi:hypothetical protein
MPYACSVPVPSSRVQLRPPLRARNMRPSVDSQNPRRAPTKSTSIAAARRLGRGTARQVRPRSADRSTARGPSNNEMR